MTNPISSSPETHDDEHGRSQAQQPQWFSEHNDANSESTDGADSRPDGVSCSERQSAHRAGK